VFRLCLRPSSGQHVLHIRYKYCAYDMGSHKVALTTGWTVWGSNPGGGEIFCVCPDRPWSPPSLLYSGYQVSFLGVKRPGSGVYHPPSSSAEVKERVELYLYSPSGSSWPVIGCTLTLTFISHVLNCNWLQWAEFIAKVHLNVTQHYLIE
jgi:hypothetical protein